MLPAPKKVPFQAACSMLTRFTSFTVLFLKDVLHTSPGIAQPLVDLVTQVQSHMRYKTFRGSQLTALLTASHSQFCANFCIVEN
jgi:hypothetical protein